MNPKIRSNLMCQKCLKSPKFQKCRNCPSNRKCRMNRPVHLNPKNRKSRKSRKFQRILSYRSSL